MSYNTSEYNDFDFHTDKVLISSGLKKKIFRFVILGHIIIIALPLLVYYINKFFKSKKPRIIQVKLVPPPQEKVPVIKERQISKPVTRQPRKKKVVKRKPKPKKVVKKVPKQKTKPKPKKRTWLKSDEIKVAKAVVKAKNEPTPVVPQYSAKNLASKLRKNIKFTAKTAPRPGVSASKMASYYDQVAAYLYQCWKQPGKAQLGGRKPSVMVHVSIDGNGKIKVARFAKRSGISVMDASVEKLLAKLIALPKPPSGPLDFDVTLDIED